MGGGCPPVGSMKGRHSRMLLLENAERYSELSELQY